MVKNQIEFNNKFPLPKKDKEIKIRYKKFTGELVIEDYLELENLQLLKVTKIEKLILRNLTQLKECTIQGCGMVELVIDNCPQVKILNIRNNSLTNLNFLVNLENLAELKMDGNTQLAEILKPYKNDWKVYQKDLQEIKQGNFSELAKKFWDLKQSREDLKKDISILLPHYGATSKEIITTELVLNLGKEFKNKKKEINYLELRINELTNLIKNQKTKIISTFLRLLPEKELVQKLITTHLEFIGFKKQAIDSEDYGEEKWEYEQQIGKLKYELRTKLPNETKKDTMNKLEAILTDCEKLVEQELELETKLADKAQLIEKQKQNSLLQESSEESNKRKRIIDAEEATQQQQQQQFKRIRSNSLVTEIEKARLEGKVEVYKELALLPKTITTNQGVIIQGDRNKCGDYSVRDNTMSLVENPAEKYQAQTEIPPK